jgi:hypothetical protein
MPPINLFVALLFPRYKAALYDDRVIQWEKEHNKKSFVSAYPTPFRAWNGWFGYWCELGPYMRKRFLGYLAASSAALLCGLMLPLNFRYGDRFGLPLGGDAINISIALYGSFGWHSAAVSRIIISSLLKKNMVLECVSIEMWPRLFMRHCSSVLVACLGIIYIDALGPFVTAQLLLGIECTTGLLHHIPALMNSSSLRARLVLRGAVILGICLLSASYVDAYALVFQAPANDIPFFCISGLPLAFLANLGIILSHIKSFSRTCNPSLNLPTVKKVA